MKIGALNSYILELHKLGLVIKYESPQCKRVGNKSLIYCGELEVNNDKKCNEESLYYYLRTLDRGNYGLMLCYGGLEQIHIKLSRFF